jgi:predicted phage terminase large subunit-like protein
MRYCWRNQDPFLEGRHTIEMADHIDRDLEEFAHGKSTFKVFTCPPRHGKSDLAEIYLPANFLGKFPDKEFMDINYSSALAEKFSRISRDIIRSPQYQRVYPGIKLREDSQSVTDWGISKDGANGVGKAQFLGMGASVTGRGFHCGVFGDYCAGRPEAESSTMRDKMWDVFVDSFLTRRAPVSIIYVVATRWHVDDPVGRIQQHMADDPKFPRFEFYNYPAKSTADKQYESGYLFPERFSADFYEQSIAASGSYGASCLYFGDPHVKGGGEYKIDNIKTLPTAEFYARCDGLQWVRGWDLASTIKEQGKNDPDFTSGCRMAVKKIRGSMLDEIYIDDWVRGQWDGSKRNQIIQQTAISDGAHVRVGIEAFAAYKDAYEQIKQALMGVRSVTKCNLAGDKLAKAMTVIPMFEAGNVYFREAPWNNEIKKQLGDFPNGVHDDDSDALTVAYETRSKMSSQGKIL